MPKFSVDIQAATEYTFQVEADTAEEAEVLAMSMYNNADEVPSHEEVFDAVITNCEEI
jgi:hypothetical protein